MESGKDVSTRQEPDSAESNESPDRIWFRRLYKKYGAIGFTACAGITLIFLIFFYISSISADPKFRMFVDMAAVLYTAFISFVIALNVTEENYHQGAARFGRTAARHIIEIHKKLSALGNSVKIARFDDPITREHYAHITNVITSIRGDVRLALNDTKKWPDYPWVRTT